MWTILTIQGGEKFRKPKSTGPKRRGTHLSTARGGRMSIQRPPERQTNPSQRSAARRRRVNDSGCGRHFHRPARKKQQKRQRKTSLRNVKYRQGPEQLEVACPPRQGLNRGQNRLSRGCALPRDPAIALLRDQGARDLTRGLVAGKGCLRTARPTGKMTSDLRA